MNLNQSDITTFDSFIESLNNGQLLTEEQIKLLCEKSKEILKKEPNVVEIKAPVRILGDIHGQFSTLLEIFEKNGKIPDANYVFLGDYVDVAHDGVQCVSLLLALKVRYQDSITLIRGNHEAREITKVYGFMDECQKKYGNTDVWEQFHSVFDCLPLAAIINNAYFCVHGGLSPSIETIDDINKLERFSDIPYEGAITDLLWSDPSDEPGFKKSIRGAGYQYGQDVTNKFLEKNNLKMLCRGHQLVQAGYEYQHADTTITLFTAINYHEKCGNNGAALIVDEDLNLSFFELKYDKPVETNEIQKA